MNKQELINWLIANSETWKNIENATNVLNGLSENVLKGLKNQSETLLTANTTLTTVWNKLKLKEGDDLVTSIDKVLTVANEKAAAKNTEKTTKNKTEIEIEDEEETDDEGKPVGAKKAKNAATMPKTEDKKACNTLADWLKDAPAEVREVFNQNAQELKEAKAELLQKLIANVSDETEKAAMLKELSGESLTRLKMLSKLTVNAKKPETEQKKEDDFGGFGYLLRGTGSANQTHTNNAKLEDDTLETAVIKW